MKKSSFSLGFPARQSQVTKEVRPRHLLPMVPRASWDGWFAIALFPPEAPLRWLKAHLFHRACRPGRHPLAVFEGMDAVSELVIMFADTRETTISRCDLNLTKLQSTTSPFCVEAPNCFRFAGETPQFTMDFRLPEAQTRASFRFTTDWPIWWSRWGRLLHYVGQHAMVTAELERAGRKIMHSGLGVMEHVCGAAPPFDVTRLAPLHWHWDVLSFTTPDDPGASAAGLALGLGGRTRVRLRAGLRLPGEKARALRGLDVRYLEFSEEPGPDGRPIAVPQAWEGVMNNRRGELRYEARRATPVAKVVPGGGFLGFDFTAEWRPPRGASRPLSGVGFCEYGDFMRRLTNRRGTGTS